MNDTWPQLEALELRIPSSRLQTSAQGTGFYHSGHIFELLPRSLKSLNLIDTSYGFYYWQSIPQNLERLDLEPSDIDLDALSQLPPSLTHVRGLDRDAYLALVKDPEMLPNLAVFPTAPKASDLAPEVTKWVYDGGKWPEKLEKIVLRDAKPQTVFDQGVGLPIFLKDLTVAIDTSERIKSFPSFLTSVNLNILNWNKISYDMWPPTIKRFSIFKCKFGLQNFCQLPRTLTYCRLEGPFDPKTDKRVPIDTLLEIGRNMIQSHDYTLWRKRETELMDENFDWPTGKDHSAYCYAIRSGRLFGLPIDLETLIIGPHHNEECNTLILPPRIKSITVSGTTVSQPGFIHLLPASITEISSTFPQYTSTKGIPAPEASALYQLINLETLSISSDENFAPLAFMCAPRNLKTLNFSTKSYCTSIMPDMMDMAFPTMSCLTKLCIRGNRPTTFVCRLVMLVIGFITSPRR